jgi:hypothetical protein
MIAYFRFNLNTFIALFFIAVLSIISIIFLEEKITILLSFIILFFFGAFFFRSPSFKFFLFSYLLGTIICCLIIYSNYISNGTPFLGGGDDELFYDYSVRYSKFGLNDFDINYVITMPYKFYILINALFFDFLKLLGVRDFCYVHILLLNVFVGASSSVFVHKIINQIVTQNIKDELSYLVISFPYFVFYNSNLLRECWIVFFFLVIIYQTISLNRPVFFRIILIIIAAILTFFIRPASAFFIITFPVCYVLFSKKLKLSYILVMLVIIGIIYLQKDNIYNRDIKETQEMYQELSSQSSDKNSIGLKLVTSDNIFMRILSILYLVFSPIPPPIVKVQNINSVVLSVGSIFWYILLPTFFLSIRKFKLIPAYRKVIIPFVLSFVISAFVVSNTSADPRHLIPFYSIIILFGILFSYHHKKIYVSYIYLFIALVPLLGVTYLIMKFIL